MSERILIKFKASGDNRLRASMIKLAGAQSLLEKNTKEFRKALSNLSGAFDKADRKSRLLNNSFATLRSKMLLFSFAMSLGGRQLIEFSKKAAELQAMETAFTTLQGGTESASIAMDKLKDATDNTMSNFNLFQQANNAMVLGITKNSDEMAEMFDIAQRLGRALGVDTKRSVESLITGIGRQSRLMLDNIGIVVKSEEAYEEYAKKLGISAKELSDADKKQAFLNATMEAAREKVAGLGAEVLSPIDSFDQLSAAWDNFTSRLGDVFTGQFQPVISLLTKFLDLLSTERLKSYAEAVKIVTAAWVGYKIAQNAATFSVKNFNKTLVKSGWGIAILGLGELINWLGLFEEAEEEATEKVEEAVVGFAHYNDEVVKTAGNLDALIEIESKAKKEFEALNFQVWLTQSSLNSYNKVLEEAADTHSLQFSNAIDQSIKLQADLAPLLDEHAILEGVLINLAAKRAELEAQKAASQASYIPNLQNEVALLKLKTQFEGDDLAIETALLKIQQKGLDFNDEELKAIKKLILEREALTAQIKEQDEAEKNSNRAKADAKKLRKDQISDAQKIVDSMKSEMEIIEEQISLYTDLQVAALQANDFEAVEAYSEAMGVLNQQAADLKETLEDAKIEDFLDKDAVKAFSNAFESEIVRAIETGKMSLDSFGKAFLKMINQMIAEIIAAETIKLFFRLGMMMINPAAGVTSTVAGGVANMGVSPAPIPYHDGGMIRGRQKGGNVPMIGQEGEFVMRRSAVDSIGLENLNRMNRTGEATGATNITFTGNIMSDTFIEEEAIPKIKDAIRRGEDLGINY